jgi:SHS2 domain-containing protein
VRPAYRLIDHTADLGFEVEGADWPGLLAAATAALGDVILADDGRPAEVEVPVAVTGADREDVLVAWLSAAAVAYEDRGLVPRGARFDACTEREARGVVRARRTDPRAEPPDRVVKAVTYHDLHVLPAGEGRPWRATVVLDL